MHEQENGSGFLEVGTNDKHEVVINLPRDMTGHIVFSIEQAEGLAATLTRKAREAQQARRDASEAARIASLPPVDRTKQCTTSGESPADVRAKQRAEGNTGQHSSYIVLCEEERVKGFVRPYRDAYRHVGRARCSQCGATSGSTTCDATGFACQMEAHGGCGSVTTMGRALSETYARDPGFYGATFCVACNAHFPVAEFAWTADNQPVGS